MVFSYEKGELSTLAAAQGYSFLLTNGLGGYASASAAFSVPRCDQGILVAAVKAPNVRINMVHRLRETLEAGGNRAFLSAQEFAGGETEEDGYRHLTDFSVEYTPRWHYQALGVEVCRECCMEYEKNTAAVVYTIRNRSPQPCVLRVEPMLKFAPKEQALTEKTEFTFDGGRITAGEYTLYIKSSGSLEAVPTHWETLYYPEDEKDGRPASGMAASCCAVSQCVCPGEQVKLEIVFSMEDGADSGWGILEAQEARLSRLEAESPLADPLARQLLRSADAFIARRGSTAGKTILAGYPLFSDWGRDTMISLPGCVLAAGRYDDAKGILRTFLAYEKDGLVPNLFPEGGQEPRYNTVDAALLLIDCLWRYLRRTGDMAFLAEAYPVMERIIAGYQKGTHHSIFMDGDALIHAGGGLDQVTWMDVCVQGILPTPRHGKPVEVNAYWYNALRIMERFAAALGRDGSAYGALARRVKASFVEKFYMEDRGYLKDVLSGTKADTQLRCNQIWALAMPFTMLSPEQERRVVEAVREKLYTPRGLRTLAPDDPEYRGFYGGSQMERDLAYHQGTVWVFPMGAYWLAWLKVHGYTREAARQVRSQLSELNGMLREGCAGQLPEIYDGDRPAQGKGCFAQAWSVGEMLRVLETLDAIENGKEIV